MMTATPLVHDQFRAAITAIIEQGTPDERRLAELLLAIYDLSCEIPRVAHFVDNWAIGVLNAA